MDFNKMEGREKIFLCLIYCFIAVVGLLFSLASPELIIRVVGWLGMVGMIRLSSESVRCGVEGVAALGGDDSTVFGVHLL